jgi:hypothetical protein
MKFTKTVYRITFWVVLVCFGLFWVVVGCFDAPIAMMTKGKMLTWEGHVVHMKFSKTIPYHVLGCFELFCGPYEIYRITFWVVLMRQLQ